MFLMARRGLVASAPSIRQCFSTKASSTIGAWSTFNQVTSKNVGENKDRSFLFLFDERPVAKDNQTPSVLDLLGQSRPTKTDKDEANSELRDDLLKIDRVAKRDEVLSHNAEASFNYLLHGLTAAERSNLDRVMDALLEDLEKSVPQAVNETVVEMMNRNARAPKKANHGRRPCSHVARRSKRMKRHKGW